MLANNESMISKVIVRVVDEDTKRDTPKKFYAIVAGIRTLGLQQVDEFQIACARFAVGPLREGHRGHER